MLFTWRSLQIEVEWQRGSLKIIWKALRGLTAVLVINLFPFLLINHKKSIFLQRWFLSVTFFFLIQFFNHFLFSPAIWCSNYCRDSGSDTWQRLYLWYFSYAFVASKTMMVILVIISFSIYPDLFFILIIHILCGDVVQIRLFYSHFTFYSTNGIIYYVPSLFFVDHSFSLHVL